MNLVLATLCGLAAPARAATVVVGTKSGDVAGNAFADHQEFLAIPYAEQPVGPLRFKPTVPVRPWNTTFDASSLGPGCPQDCSLPPGTCPENGVSEACLHMNIYTPKSASNATKLPVLFFIPGGRFEQGASGCMLYNATNLASKNGIVVVTVNYRLGTLGALTTSSGSSPGNLAILDQIAALTWVQNNIAAFGGDPAAVTLSGESAGATSVSVLVTMPSVAPLYARAIIQSNPMGLTLKDKGDATTTGDAFLKSVGCDKSSAEAELECLQGLSIPAIMAGQADAGNHVFVLNILQIFYPWAPHVDGNMLTGQPVFLFNQGKAPPAGKDIMIGAVTNEATLFIYEAASTLGDGPVSTAKYDAAMAFIFGYKAPKVLLHYSIPKNESGDARPLLSRIGSEFLFHCPIRYAVKGMAAKGTNVWMYRMDQEITDPADAWGGNYTMCQMKDTKCHGTDLLYMFDPPGYAHWGAGEEGFSESVGKRWAQFVKTGNPADPEDGWSVWKQDTMFDMVLHMPEDAIESGYLKADCDFWDGMGSYACGSNCGSQSADAGA